LINRQQVAATWFYCRHQLYPVDCYYGYPRLTGYLKWVGMTLLKIVELLAWQNPFSDQQYHNYKDYVYL
jgi:hypothetical protein